MKQREKYFMSQTHQCRDEEYATSTDYGCELLNNIQALGFQVSDNMLIDFESFLPRGDEEEEWSARVLALQADVRLYLAQTKLDKGCWSKV